MDRHLLEVAARLLDQRQPYAVATVVRRERPSSATPGNTALITGDGTVHGFIGGSCTQPEVVCHALAALGDRSPRLLSFGGSPDGRDDMVMVPMSCGSEGRVEVHVNPVFPAPQLVVAGDSPIARAVARLGEAMGYEVADGLEGARIGIPRAFYYEPVEVGGETIGGLRGEAAALMADAISVLEAAGAVVVDPAEIPSFVDPDPDANFNTWPLCIGGHQAKGSDEGCSVNFKYGMKRDFDAWLASLGPSAPVGTLTELREWNLAHRAAGSMKYEQSRYDISDEMDVEADRARNAADMAKDSLLSQERGIDAVLEEYDLDAIFTPGSRGAALAARAQYPHIVVPFGFVPNAPTPAFPEGFDARPAPFGIGFTGAACSEPRLIELAYAFEQATLRRVPPESFP